MDSDNEHENRWMADKETDLWLSGADPGRANCQRSCNAFARRGSRAAKAECAFQWSSGCRSRQREREADCGFRAERRDAPRCAGSCTVAQRRLERIKRKFAAQPGSTTKWRCASRRHGRSPSSGGHGSFRIASERGGNCAGKAAAGTYLPDQRSRSGGSLRCPWNSGSADACHPQPAAVMDYSDATELTR